MIFIYRVRPLSNLEKKRNDKESVVFPDESSLLVSKSKNIEKKVQLQRETHSTIIERCIHV